MNFCFQSLSNIYNFVAFDSKSQIQIHTNLLSQFTHIHSLLKDFIQNDKDPKSSFHNLYLFLVQQQQFLGPHSFTKLIESTTAIVIQYVLTKFRSNQTDLGILSLTYFQRSCKNYFNLSIKMLIKFSYALAQLSKKTYKIIQNYLIASSNFLTIFQKSAKAEQNLQCLQLLQSLFLGIFYYFDQRLTKAKSIFSEIISTLSLRIHLQISKKNHLSLFTINLFILATFFISLTYKLLGLNDLSAYNLTQCYQFAINYLPNYSRFVQLCFTGNYFSYKGQVKLSRIEHKIERIKSLHSIKISTIKNVTNIKSINFLQPKLKKINLVQNKVPLFGTQLKNIFTLDEKTHTRSQFRTLHRINKQNQEKTLKIQSFKRQVNIFLNGKRQIKQHFYIDEHTKEILQIQKTKQSLKSQIVSKIWSVAHKLSPTKKIQFYIHSFKTSIFYFSTNRFYRLLYSDVGLIGHLTIFTFVRRYKSKFQRLGTKSIVLNSVRHQLQFLIHKITKKRYIKVYNVMKGCSVDDFVQVSEQIFLNLQYLPLEYHFYIHNFRLYDFQKYLQSLSERVRIQINLFVLKLKQKLAINKGELKYKRNQIQVTFGSYKSNLLYTLFVLTKKQSQTQYIHKIFRIDKAPFKNPDYNIKINKTLISHNLEVQKHYLNQIVVSSLIHRKQMHHNLVISLQNHLRMKIALNQSLKLRQKTSIITTQISKNLFTLILQINSKTFYIQHLEKNYPPQILKGVDFFNLAFINKLRPQLGSTQNCQVQLSIIKKYFRLRQFGRRMISKSKQFILNSNYSVNFKKSLCFAKIMPQVFYKGKFVDAKAMYMLTIQDFQLYPRPYLLRVFNLQSKALYRFDFQKVLFMSQKIFLESNLTRINTVIDIQGNKFGNILSEGLKPIIKNKRINSKSTVLSNYSFKHQSLNEIHKDSSSKSRISYHIQARQSLIVNRNKKNSINYKMRHKSALKQKDILLIKKWIENSKQNHLISQSSQSNDP